jgi:hypothetical protein
VREQVSGKLDLIDELFPPERLDASKARIRALKNNERPTDRSPFIFSALGFNYYDDVMPREQRLDRVLDEIIAHGRTQDDFIPQFFPGCRVATIPDMFGAKEQIHVRPDGRKEYGVCESMFSSDDDPRSLPDPVIAPDSIAAFWLDMQQYVVEETAGRLPVSVIDMQGPMDVAAQLWGYDNLFLDAMGDGEKAKALLDRCTTAFIELWRRQQELLGDLFVGTHLWGWSWVEQGADHGASLSMDGLAMISAEFFTEHTREHLVRISEAFGGLAIHSCGDFSAVVPGINEIPGIDTINSSQMSLGALKDAGIDPARFITVSRNYDDIEIEYRLIKDENLNVEMTIGGVWPEWGKAPDLWSPAEWDTFRQKEDLILDLSATQ